MRKLTALAALALLAAPLTTAPASAKVKIPAELAYSNLGSGGSFSTDYYYVAGPVHTAFTYAAPFSPSQSGNLDYIDLPLTAASTDAGVIVSIFPDLNGVPGTYANGGALEEWVLVKVPGTVAAVKFVSKHKPLLTAGQPYWVIVAPLFYDSVVYWWMNNINQSGVDATPYGGWANSWTAYGANGYVMPALDVWVK